MSTTPPAGKSASRIRLGFLRSPTWGYPLLFLAFYIAIFAYYDFRLVPDRRAGLIELDFRRLAAAGDQIASRIDSFATILATQANDPGRPKPDSGLLVPGFQFDDCSPAGRSPGTPGLTIRLSSEGADTVVRLRYQKASTAVCGRSSMRAFAGAFLDSIPEEDVDDVALITTGGDVVYQVQRTAIRFSSVRALFEEVSAGKASTPASAAPEAGAGRSGAESRLAAGHSRSVAATIAEQAFQVLVQPIRVEVLTSQRGSAEAPSDLALVGFVRNDRLMRKAWALPIAPLVNISLLVLLALVGLWPVLKVWKMGPADGFRPNEILFFGVSLMAGAVLLTNLILYDCRNDNYTETDRRLEDLSSAIERNVHQELGQMLAAMDDLSDRERQLAGQRKPVNMAGNILLGGEDITEIARVAHRSYPWFEQVFWADKSGNQPVKWSVRAQPTPPTRIDRRPFFINAQSGKFWRLSPPGRSRLDRGASGTAFVLDTEYSVNTGDYMAVLLKPLGGVPNGKPVQPSSRARPVNAEVAVVMLSQLLSLSHPVLPPEYGFAVIDASGMVRFHADPLKNLRENMFRELDQAAELRASVDSESARTFLARYQGRDCRLYVRPLQIAAGSHWFVVTFFDLAGREFLHFNAITLTLVCSFALQALLAGCLLAGRLIAGLKIAGHWFKFEPAREKWRSMLRNKHAVVVMAAAYSGLCVLLTVGRSLGPSWAWSLAAGGPVIAILGTSVAVRLWRPAAPGEPGVTEERAPYGWIVLTSMILLLLTSVLPVATFFRLSFDHARIAYTRAGQVRLAQGLRERAERIRGELRRVGTDAFRRPFEDDAAFLTRRISDTKLDRYDLTWSNLPYRLLGQTNPPEQSGRVTCQAGEDPLLCKVGAWTRFLRRFMPRAQTESIGVIERRRWRWTLAAEDRLGMVAGDAAAQPRDSIISQLPSCSYGRKETFLLTSMMVFFGAVMAGSTFLRFRVRGRPPREWDTATLDQPKRYTTSNTLVLCFPRTVDLDAFRADEDCQVHEATELNNPGWRRRLNQRRLVVVNHMETVVHGARSADGLLQAISELVADPNHNLLLLSTIDPIYYRFEPLVADKGAASAASEEELNLYSRWISALNTFEREVQPAPPGARIGPEAWHLFWETCAPREKLTLWQLAGDGVVNPKNRFALAHLYLRRAVRWPEGTMPEIADADLASFVRSELPSKQMEVYLSAQQESAWKGLKLALISTILVLPIFLAVAWTDFWQAGFGKIVTVGSAGTVAVQMVSKVMEVASTWRAKIGANA